MIQDKAYQVVDWLAAQWLAAGPETPAQRRQQIIRQAQTGKPFKEAGRFRKERDAALEAVRRHHEADLWLTGTYDEWPEDEIATFDIDQAKRALVWRIAPFWLVHEGIASADERCEYLVERAEQQRPPARGNPRNAHIAERNEAYDALAELVQVAADAREENEDSDDSALSVDGFSPEDISEVVRRALENIGGLDADNDLEIDTHSVAPDDDLLQTDDPYDRQIGRRFGDRTVRRCLGGGAGGVVYLAWHENLERNEAIKFLPPLKTDDSSRRQFETERRALVNLRHQYIVRILDAGLDGVRPYIVMEYLEGGSLADRLSTRGLTRKEIRTVLRQIASALDFAHERGIIHRDVKPANILLTADGDAVLADFGIATMNELSLRSGMSGGRGTPAYMAPEQAMAHGRATASTDVYALGCVAYELVCGRPPFSADNPYQLADMHRSSKPTSPSALNPDMNDLVDAVLLAALAKRPADRPASAGDLAAQLASALGTAT